MKRSFIFFSLILSLSTHAQEVHELKLNGFVQEYLVIGPFHQEGLSADDWPELLEIPFIENEGRFAAVGQVSVAENNRLDFNKILGDSAMALAYAQFKVRTDQPTHAQFRISAEDGAKVFINGEAAFTYFGGGWGSKESFSANLDSGDNLVQVKVPSRDWGWNLSLQIVDEGEAAKIERAASDKREEFALYHSRLIPEPTNNFRYTFYPGRFPVLLFENPLLVRKYLGGDFTMVVRWFDRELNEVTYPKEPGKYAYYAEITGSNGRVLKRSATLFCAPQDWMGWTERLKADLSYYPINGAPKEVWEEYADGINQISGFIVFESILQQEKGALLQAFVDDMNRDPESPGPLNTPMIRNGDYHARLKQKLLGVENTYPELKEPRLISDSSPTLKNRTEKEVKKYRKMTSELINVGNSWLDDEGGPFDMVIAKEGQILFHESFGKNLYGTFTTETKSEVASITKLMTGVLFAQFVDQGIIGIDDYVGQYLPDFPLEGPNAVTLRHCFTHTAGFDFFAHGIYGGVHNPWLETTLLQTIEGDTVGNQLLYNGMGYDLAGKVMEVVTGKSIFRLLRECIYDPLGMDDTAHDWDLGFSIHSTAYDLAKVAQLLLNKGRYGNLQFFSPETYDKLVPTDLNQYYPKLNEKWGIGMNPMDWKVKDEKTGEYQALVSDGIIGHGSATATVFWVIPKQDMLITQTRRRGNRNYAPNYIKMMKVVEQYLID